MCRYILATNWQNLTKIHLAYVKILQKVVGRLLFLTHTVQFTYLMAIWRHNCFAFTLHVAKMLVRQFICSSR